MDNLWQGIGAASQQLGEVNYTRGSGAQIQNTTIQKKRRTMSSILVQREDPNDQINGRETGEQTQKCRICSSAAHKNTNQFRQRNN